jgi:DNA repair protein RadD
MLQLRPYQQEAIDAVYAHLRTRDDNPCVVIPTAGGKTPVIASVCKDAVGLWGGRVLVLAHVKELLEQAADKLRAVCPEVPFGVYSAGLKRRDRREPVIVAGIQSVWKKACEFDPFDLVVVDEAHLIPPEGDGMYRQFLDDAKKVNPNLRIVGCTATPYRLKSGTICTPDGFLNHVCYEVGVRELIVQGYLCPLVSKAGRTKFDTAGLHTRGGEFVADEVEDLMDQEALVKAACAEIVEATRTRKACLIFAAGVRHGQHVAEVLKSEHGLACGFVSGETDIPERDRLLGEFKAGRLKYLCNVNVLTTGFDAPHIDCVALLRPTLSPGLFYQMVGRGFRLHPSKADCLVLDFGGNVLRHGPVDRIKVKAANRDGTGQAPAKECPACHALIPAAYAACPQCGYEFPPPERQTHDAKASTAAVLSGAVTTETFAVQDVFFSVHTKRGAGDDAPKSMRVDYKVGWHRFKSEWVCFEHTGFARQKAVAWWRKRSREPVPATAAEAVEVAKAGGLAPTTSITVRSVSGEDYDRITDHQLGPIPEAVGPAAPAADDALDFPFGYNVATTEEEIPW